MADKYFSSKAANEKANEAALVAMAEGVRGDLGQVTKAHVGLYRQLQDQSAQIAELGEEVKRARLALEQHDHRLEAQELRLRSIDAWVKVTAGVVVVSMGTVIFLLLRMR
jgi:chromosome segregation ATPase